METATEKWEEIVKLIELIDKDEKLWEEAKEIIRKYIPKEIEENGRRNDK